MHVPGLIILSHSLNIFLLANEISMIAMCGIEFDIGPYIVMKLKYSTVSYTNTLITYMKLPQISSNYLKILKFIPLPLAVSACRKPSPGFSTKLSRVPTRNQSAKVNPLWPGIWSVEGKELHWTSSQQLGTEKLQIQQIKTLQHIYDQWSLTVAL